MGNKLNLEGFAVSDENVCTADGGFVGNLGDEDENLVIDGDIVQIKADTQLQVGNSSTSSMVITAQEIKMQLLPTSDPGSLNQLWNNAGVLTVSAG